MIVGWGHDPTDQLLNRRGVPNMEKTDERFPVRKSPRIPNFDYSTPNYYFVTICTNRKTCLFGNPGKENWRGKIAEKGLLQINQHFSSVLVDKYVVMPNHVHAIIILQDDQANLTTVVGQYKSYVTRQIHKMEPDIQVWQTSFHDHGIRTQAGYEKIWNYIEGNPAKWCEDCFFAE